MTIHYNRTPLIVIDMQPDYYADRNRNLMKAVKREIKAAVKRKALIIFVEYPQEPDSSRTYKSLTDLAKNVDHFFILKNCVNGTKAIVKFTSDMGINLSRFKRIRVCGVEANCCVEATVQGLMDYFEDYPVVFDVVEDATANPYGRITWKRILGFQGQSKIKRKRIFPRQKKKVG